MRKPAIYSRSRALRWAARSHHISSNNMAQAADEQGGVRGLSDSLFRVGTSAPIVVKRDDVKSAKRQRSWLLAQIRNAVIESGRQLVSPSPEHAFSKHGSLFHRLNAQHINDIDVYVVLSGNELMWNGKQLEGSTGKVGVVEHRAPLPSARSQAKWMFEVVSNVLSEHDATNKVSEGTRGAVVKKFGTKERNYDIIPAYLYKDDQGNHHHIIPADGGVWESNPTAEDMRAVIELDKKFQRDSETKKLGYRDLVKVLKYLRTGMQWDVTPGITSFMIRFAVQDALASSVSEYNQKNIANALAVLQSWITGGGFCDRYTGKLHTFTNQLQLNAASAASTLSPSIWAKLIPK